MKTYKKDVTDEEVNQLMLPFLEELRKDVRPRVRIEELVDEQKQLPMDEKPESENEKELLRSVFENPNFNISGHANHLGWTAHRMNKVKRELERKEMIKQFEVFHKSRHCLLALTDEGYKALGEEQSIRKPENVSHEHWWWQVKIYEYYKERGVKSEIEQTKNGISADVGIEQDGKEIAIEVELSPRNAISNISEDLGAGFNQVRVYCKNTKVLQEVKRRFKNLSSYEEIKDKVEISLLIYLTP